MKDTYGDPYGLHNERLSLKDKNGKSLYKKKGNDIVPRDGGYVYPNLLGNDRHASQNKEEAKKMKRQR
jgi:hypothetical protein